MFMIVKGIAMTCEGTQIDICAHPQRQVHYAAVAKFSICASIAASKNIKYILHIYMYVYNN